MKGWILPAAALLLAGIWVGQKQAAIAGTERKTTVLRERIARIKAQHQESSGPGEPSGTSSPLAGDPGSPGFDWQEIGEAVARMDSGGAPDMRLMIRLQKMMMELDEAGITRTLDEIAAAEMSDDARQILESMILGALSEKAPELAVKRYFEGAVRDEGARAYMIGHAFKNWLAESPDEARAWFEERAAAGDFASKSLDGNNPLRLQLEGALVLSLLARDPGEAADLLQSIPEEKRQDLFLNGFSYDSLEDGNEGDYAELVRDNLPEGSQMMVLAQPVDFMIHQGGYERISGYLEAISATAEERQEIVSHALTAKLSGVAQHGDIDSEAIDDMRAWLNREAPDSVARMTGEALGNYYGGDWEDRLELVDELLADGDGDDLLVAFLETGQVRGHGEDAIRLAERIEDEARRAEVMERLNPREGNE